MNLKTLVSLIVAAAFLASCSQKSSSAPPPDYTCRAYTGTTMSNPHTNVTNVNVGCHYVNEPCVSIKICEPGTANCKIINDILLDTGSYGLRLFSCTHTLNLPSVTDGSGNQIAELTGFADGSCDWGPVKLADITIGSGDTAPSVPVHMIDYSYPHQPSAAQSGFNCLSLDYSPQVAGFNGILGVGMAKQDCGNYCTSVAGNGAYFSCTGSACTGTTVTLLKQVTNPIAKMSVDNNGVILTFPSVAAAGAPTLLGTFTLGIDTASGNNSAGALIGGTFHADNSANFRTTYTGVTDPTKQLMTSSFIDSGSNTLAFPDDTLTKCPAGSIADGFYCPATLKILSATQADTSGAPFQTASFKVANAAPELVPTNPNMVFDNLAAVVPSIATTPYFDWGFPFFINKTVYTGITGGVSTLGTGPYWAW